ncbi:MAG: nickel pincer cofactor biosynthesis protein LarC [Oscillospiraceae bacterium]|nr:nickel pincer cofactor biosynthesis protein LarC [Oscillospiraceae bacterium]
MKILYLDCGMGAAGDMLTAALAGLLPAPDKFTERLGTLFEGVHFELLPATKCGITGQQMSVRIKGVDENEIHEQAAHDPDEHTHHHHRTMKDIEDLVEKLDVPGKVKRDILAVYGIIADAESHVHGVPVTDIHFHEVGTLDALADITAVCLAMYELAPNKVYASPVHVGCGSVKCAHGVLPVPAPATEQILRDVPIYGGKIEGELCTPTGAALLKYFVDRFGDMPIMSVSAAGYGMGSRDYPQANCVRALLGGSDEGSDPVIVLSCTIDDMTAEDISYAMKMLFSGGAMDVYTLPVCMKKSRMGTMLCVVCPAEIRDSMIEMIFRHTSTIGVREEITRRYVLKRHTETVDSPLGEIHRKVSEGYGVTRIKYEHDDLERMASENYMSIEELRMWLLSNDAEAENDK